MDTPFLLRILLFCLIGSLQQLALIRGAARGQYDSITGARRFQSQGELANPGETSMSNMIDRRDFFQGTFGAAVVLAETPAFGETPVVAGVSPTIFMPKPLSFDPKSIKGISEKVLVSHYENNYLGAVKRLGSISAQLAELDFAKAPNFVINGLKREELIALNSAILHELYFDSLGGSAAPSGPLLDAITRNYGSFDRWRLEFSAIGKAEGGGSGWVILAYSPREKKLITQWAADHTTTIAGGRPILVLDMYEHAYHMDYGAKAGAYVDAFIEAIHWDNAAMLYEQYSREG